MDKTDKVCDSRFAMEAPKQKQQNLVVYAISRTNARQAGLQVSEVAPRVAFTDRKINYSKEFALAFGDYC
jgi:hypothetical protein